MVTVPSSPACAYCGAASSLAWIAHKTSADSYLDLYHNGRWQGSANSDSAVALSGGLGIERAPSDDRIECVKQQQAGNKAADVSLPGDLLALFANRDGPEADKQI